MFKQNSHIPLIIPSYEPDERLIELLKRLTNSGYDNIIIVNDGSSEEYSHFFEDAKNNYNCTVIRHFINLGKGRALKTAFNYCLSKDPDLIGCVTADSDGQHTSSDIASVMEALIKEPENLILGCRDFSNGNIPKKSYFGNTLTRQVCRFLCGVNVSDTQTGLRGIPKAFMADLLDTAGERFEFETRMLIESKNNFPITEIPIETIYDSKENHQTHFDPVKDSIRIYKIFGGEFAKFIVSSLSSSVLDLVLFALFCKIFNSLYAGIYITLATVSARVLSATYNYIINYAFVFKSKENRSLALFKYASLAIVQMSLSALFVTLLVTAFSNTPEVVIKIIVDTILFFISYYIQREIVFNRKK
ncbi:MAG: bifunctional glycosyltransferase family 2/GtrA family protein [Lachnospiraceae bacterium]|nr:bifunctional glycosyltransferase family 2/GtrA family protein [Lachnospiraceae bacterium]